MRATFAAAILLMALPALAQTAAAQPVQVTSVAESDAGAAAASNDQRVRCRRIPITGSWVRVERVCKTVAEWRRLSDRGNDVVRQHWENGLVCSGGECRGIEPPE